MVQFRSFTFLVLCLFISVSAISEPNHDSLAFDMNGLTGASVGATRFRTYSLNQESSESTTTWSDVLVNDGYDIFQRFLEGFGFHDDIASSSTCFDSSESFASKIKLAVSEFRLKNYYTGIFNSTESLKYAGNFTRHCYATVEESYAKTTKFFSDFNSLNEYYTQLQADFFTKFTTLSITYTQLKDALANQDYKLAGYHIGYAIRNVLEVDPPPPPTLLLAPPLQQTSRVRNLQTTVAENFFSKFTDFLFPLLHHSNTITNTDQINSCSSAMSSYNTKLKEISAQMQQDNEGAFKEGVFLFADSLSFVHPIAWECFAVASEIADSFYTRMVDGFNYEETMLNAFLYNLHIKTSYYNIKASLLNEAGIEWDKIGKELGDTIQILFFD